MTAAWKSPVPLRLIASDDSLSFRHMAEGETALPLPPHPGAYGVARKNHIHEGVDFYCASGTPVSAVEDGEVVAVIDFTGPTAGSPWWHDTRAVMVEGGSGVVLYGEIDPCIKTGDTVKAGEVLGHVVQVLREDKGRPMSMLHLELHRAGTRDCYEWAPGDAAPDSLRDPTPCLLPLTDE